MHALLAKPISRARRRWLSAGASVAAAALVPAQRALAASSPPRVLVLVELKGGNDALNTVVPYADPLYASLRPRLALGRDDVVQLDEHTGLHPALAPLATVWSAGELAIVRGIGYDPPNLSHFRSIDIWDTGSASSQVLGDGWAARALAAEPGDVRGVVIGAPEPGPLLGAQRVVVMQDPARFARLAGLATAGPGTGTAALRHVLQVEDDVQRAARALTQDVTLAAEFPRGPFGDAVRTAAHVIAGCARRPDGAGLRVVRIALGGFDTHRNQRAVQDALLAQLASGLVALRTALIECGAWPRTLVVTYSEFGRRVRENASGGTDHGAASSQLALGPTVRGGLLGPAPRLDRLDAAGNLVAAIDFRQWCATLLDDWLGLDARAVLGARHERIALLRG